MARHGANCFGYDWLGSVCLCWAVSEGNGNVCRGLARMRGAWQSWMRLFGRGSVCMGNVGHGSHGKARFGSVWPVGLWHGQVGSGSRGMDRNVGARKG